jgi:hypothetical protein
MSIVIMDIIYIAEIAFAAPSPPNIRKPLNHVFLATYEIQRKRTAGTVCIKLRFEEQKIPRLGTQSNRG